MLFPSQPPCLQRAMNPPDNLRRWLMLRAGAFKMSVTDAVAAFRLCVTALAMRAKHSDPTANMVLFNNAATALHPDHVTITCSHGYREAVGTCTSRWH